MKMQRDTYRQSTVITTLKVKKAPLSQREKPELKKAPLSQREKPELKKAPLKLYV